MCIIFNLEILITYLSRLTNQSGSASFNVNNTRKNNSAVSTAQNIMNHLSERERLLLNELEKTRKRIHEVSEITSKKNSSTKSSNSGIGVGVKRKKSKSNNHPPDIYIDEIDEEDEEEETQQTMLSIPANNMPAMPIFRLPAVSPRVKVLRKIPTVENKRNEEFLQRKDEEIRKEMQRKLGLSDYDFQRLHQETTTKKQKQSGSNLTLNLDNVNNADELTDENHMQQGQISSTKFNNDNTNPYDIRRTPRILRPGQWKSGAFEAESLRYELGVSLTNVQTYTEKVQHDLTQIRHMCPITSLRAQLYMKKWGLQKFEATLMRIFNAHMLAALLTWRDNVQQIIFAIITQLGSCFCTQCIAAAVGLGKAICALPLAAR